jgi:hypothetical protein
MIPRKKIPPTIEADVLEKSARRCCLCYGLDSDYCIKKGQIAHLDHKNNNNSLNNLAFLCLDHHNEYDSTTSQSKNYTLEEIKRYRKKLYEIVNYFREKNNKEFLDNQKSGKETRDAKPSLMELEFIAYYSNDDIAISEKTNINFKLKNNSSNIINCISYKFEGYLHNELIAKYNTHPFNLSIVPKQERIFPFGPVNPSSAYFKNYKPYGKFESKIYLEYLVEGEAYSKFIIGVARINISNRD